MNPAPETRGKALSEEPTVTDADDMQATRTGAASYCLNCGHKLNGEFCAACGQKNHSSAEPFREVVGDFFSDNFNFDAKVFSSILPLLFRPGVLTLEYFAGRRIRYLGPVRLYLSISILLFFIAWNFGPSPVPAIHIGVGNGNNATTAAATNKILHNPRLSDEQKKAAVAAVQGKIPKNLSGKVFGRKFKANTAELSAAFKRAIETWLPRLLFVFVPLMALLLKLLYLRSKRYYIEHLIFTLHNHAFVFVAMLVMLSLQILATKASWLVTPAHYFDGLVWCYMVVYIFLAMWFFYRQSFLRTLFKFLLAGALYWIALIVVLSVGSSLIFTELLRG